MKKVMMLFFHALFMDIQRIVKFSFIMGVLLIFSLLCAVGCVSKSPASTSQQGKITTDTEYNHIKIMHAIARYQNRHATPFEMTVLDSLSATEIGSFGDGGRYADFLAASTFASLQLLKLQMDSILSMPNHREIDSFGVFKTYFNDHYDELMGKKKK